MSHIVPITPYTFGAKGDGVADDTTALQAFFDHVGANNVGTADWSGTFRTTAGVTYTGNATRRIIGYCIVNCDAATTAVTFLNADRVMFDTIRVLCAGSVNNWDTRPVDVAVQINNCARAKFNRIWVDSAKITGIKVFGGNSNFLELGNVEANNNGPTHPSIVAGAEHDAAWSNKVDSGSAGSTSQRSTIDVTAQPVEFVADATLVDIGGNLHVITAVDAGAGTITVYPWIDTTLTSGTLYYYVGAGVYIEGSDANKIGIQTLDTSGCAVGLRSAALYGAQVTNFGAQFNAVAVAIGLGSFNSHFSTLIDNAYFEGNLYDIIQVTDVDVKSSITALNEIGDFSQSFRISGPRNAGNVIDPSFTRFKGLHVEHGEPFPISLDVPENVVGSLEVVQLGPPHRSVRHLFENNPNVELRDAPDLTRLFGYTAVNVYCYGSGGNDAPSGTVTFTAEVGYTVNGGASATFSALTGPTHFQAYLRGTNWHVVSWVGV